MQRNEEAGARSGSVHIQSEVDRIEVVVVHTPGLEIERMTPSRAEELLYNDIVPMSVVQAEHRVMSGVLRSVCECYELLDLLADALGDRHARGRLLDSVFIDGPAISRREELEALSAQELASVLVTGVPIERTTLASWFNSRGWDLPPLPNQYFMRDAGFVVRGHPMAGSMAHGIRSREALIMRTIFEWMLGETDLLFDGTSFPSRIEGGDIVVLGPNLLAAGISRRTSAEALDELGRRLSEHHQEPFTLIACVLPDERWAIHLDMVFTRISHDQALVHAPAVLGNGAFPCVRLDVQPGGQSRVREVGSLLDALAEAGCPLAPIVCGGDDPMHQAREQWLSGTNSFAIAPGKILVYDCNRYTLEELSKSGYEVVPADVYDHARAGAQRVAIALPGVELARGGGGPRCMTLPLRRH